MVKLLVLGRVVDKPPAQLCDKALVAAPVGENTGAHELCVEVIEIGDTAQSQMTGFVVVKTGFGIIAIEMGIAALAGEHLLETVGVLHDVPGGNGAHDFKANLGRGCHRGGLVADAHIFPIQGVLAADFLVFPDFFEDIQRIGGKVEIL